MRVCVEGRQQSKQGDREGEKGAAREEGRVCKLLGFSFRCGVPKYPPEGALSQQMPGAARQAPQLTKMDYKEGGGCQSPLPEALLRPGTAAQPPRA